MPVVGLVLHPVKPGHEDRRDNDHDDDFLNDIEYRPGNLSTVMIPSPVAVLVIAVGAVHCGSNPPLVSISG